MSVSFTEGCFDAKQSEEPLPGAGYAEMPALPPPPPGFHGPTAALTQGVVLPKPPKNPVQVWVVP